MKYIYFVLTMYEYFHLLNFIRLNGGSYFLISVDNRCGRFELLVLYLYDPSLNYFGLGLLIVFDWSPCLLLRMFGSGTVCRLSYFFNCFKHCYHMFVLLLYNCSAPTNDNEVIIIALFLVKELRTFYCYI